MQRGAWLWCQVASGERRKFLESNPFCVKCYEEGHITMVTVVDHIVPHRETRNSSGSWELATFM